MEANIQNIINTYFSRKVVKEKAYKQPTSIIATFPKIYKQFENDPKEFQLFYKNHFKKKKQTITALTQQELYGALVVKARKNNNRLNLDVEVENIEKRLKKMRSLDFPNPEQGRSPSLGRWLNDDHETYG